MVCINSDSPYLIFLEAASLVPVSHYYLGFIIIVFVSVYNFLEFHLLGDLFTGFRGQRISLTSNPSSEFYRQVVSKCPILHGRFLSTPWLSSPHIQTAFLTFFGRPPIFNYTRQLFIMSDGGTIALDWLMNYDVTGSGFQVNDEAQKDDNTPIMIIVPGLTSDSRFAYVRHIVYKMAKRGFNVVVSNHRGLGGIAITSDCFYNAGWTEDLRKIIDHIHIQFSQAPLFTIGTSIGANIVVKYLGEEGVNTPILGAAAICSPWDLLICDRFINRMLVQRLYNSVLAIGLKGYAVLHQSVLSRMADWDEIQKSRSVRDFDNHATRVLGQYETVDTYYRRCSSTNFVATIAVPLLCISSIDDPVCTSEAIPWDECKANENIILATTQHGGHLAYFEGLFAKNIWWVRALDEYFDILQSSPLIQKKKQIPVLASTSLLGPSVDNAPYLNVAEDGLVTAVSEEPKVNSVIDNEDHTSKSSQIAAAPFQIKRDINSSINNKMEPVGTCINQLSRQNQTTIWMLAYIVFITTWPFAGPTLMSFFRKRFISSLRISHKWK